ncbi:MAG: DUF481 domain-containing protein [Sulfuricurvum sp.]|nr:DUF481 domain-containing protein [Sulfuricurvum sp.]
MPIIVLLSFFLSTSLFALVSIAPIDIGASPGFSGNVSGTLNSKSGNTDKKEYQAGVRVQYDQGSDYGVWGTLTYSYGEVKGLENENKIYAHIRYIHALYGEEWCGELFVQSEQDRFKEINERSLGGAGLRWRFFNSPEWGKGYFGAGGMLERIDYSHPAVNRAENNRRVNSYLAYTKKFPNASKLTYIGYYQPKFDAASDYVTSQTLELIVPIYGKLSLSISAKYLFDTVPIGGIEKRDTAYTTYVLWDF